MGGGAEIDVRYNLVPDWVNSYIIHNGAGIGSDAYHAYIVVTDNNGNQTYFREGPKYIFLRAEHGKYESGTPDWRGNDCKNQPRQVLLSNNDPAQKYIDKLSEFTNKFNNSDFVYFSGQNSNTYASNAINDLGLPRPIPPVYTPGWFTNLSVTPQ